MVGKWGFFGHAVGAVIRSSPWTRNISDKRRRTCDRCRKVRELSSTQQDVVRRVLDRVRSRYRKKDVQGKWRMTTEAKARFALDCRQITEDLLRMPFEEWRQKYNPFQGQRPREEPVIRTQEVRVKMMGPDGKPTLTPREAASGAGFSGQDDRWPAEPKVRGSSPLGCANSNAVKDGRSSHSPSSRAAPQTSPD